MRGAVAASIMGLLILGSLLLTPSVIAEGSETGRFPDRVFSITRSGPGGPRSDTYVTSIRPWTDGIWAVRLESLTGTAIVVQLYEVNAGIPVLLGASKLTAVGALSSSELLVAGHDYVVSFTPFGRPGTSILGEVFQARNAIGVAVVTDKPEYLTGEPVFIKVTATNTGGGTVTLHFPTACQAFFAVYDESGGAVWNEQYHVGCPAVLTEMTLGPGESHSWGFVWGQVYDLGNPVPAPARYVIFGYLTSMEPVPRASTWISILSFDVVLQVFTDKDVYAPGETVRITVNVTNRGRNAVTLHFRTSCQAFFRVQDLLGRAVYDLGRHAGCLMILTELTLGPGQSHEYLLRWAQMDDSGQSVPWPARYVVVGYLVSEEEVAPASTEIAIGGPSLAVIVTTDKTSYARGETVRITVNATNTGVAALTLTFRGCDVLFRVEDLYGRIVYTYSPTCLTYIGTAVLPPGGSIERSFTWDQVDDAGNPVPAPQDYLVVGFLSTLEVLPEGSTRISLTV